MKFIDRIAEHIIRKGIPLQQLTVILPSERMKKYLLNALFDQVQKPFFAPEVVTMDKWIKQQDENTVVERTRLLLQLYDAFRTTATTDQDTSFEEFLTWGEILVSDFNEIDRYLVDETQVLSNLADVKEIENWSFNSTELSEGQHEFMLFWNQLLPIYRTLTKNLIEKNLTSPGRAFRSLAKDPTLLLNQNDRYFIFAGFNALSASEMHIVQKLHDAGRAEILIDADVFYLNDANHEAGYFLRKLDQIKALNKFDFIRDELRTKQLDLEVILCAQHTGQVKVAATILSKLSSEELNETLLLLADEGLIASVIKNLPASIGKANITMGLPIRNTPIRTWVELLFSFQENMVKFKTKSCYHADLQKLFNHPFFQLALHDNDKNVVRWMQKQMAKYNTIFVAPLEFNFQHDAPKDLKFSERLQLILGLVTKPWYEDPIGSVKTIRRLNTLIFESTNKEHVFERAILRAFDQSLIDFENCVSEGLPEMSFRSYKHLFGQHWTGATLSYEGNPVGGLQIMGLLETRGLDFKTVICIGMNEGSLPPTNPLQTLIPLDLRRYYTMPLPRDKQGIFAHHFYRLLHHCEKMYITYSTVDPVIGMAEPGRYILQLERELARINPNINIKRRIYRPDITQENKQTHVTKSPEILKRLDELFEGSTSASMLNTYLNCPLDFYYRYVLEFGDEQEVEEELEHSTFGTLIHATLEELYKPFSRFTKEGDDRGYHQLTVNDVEGMLLKCNEVLKGKFSAHFLDQPQAFSRGKNLLAFEMASELIERFLKAEIAFIQKSKEPLFIEALEKEVITELEINVGGTVKKIRLRGIIDRVDRLGEKVRIIDYKTGRVDGDELKFMTGEEDQILKSMRNKKHVLQMLHYAYMYQNHSGALASPGIISLISGNFQVFELDTRKLTLEDVLPMLPEQLSKLFSEIYDEDLPFSHIAGYTNYCRYCS